MKTIRQTIMNDEVVYALNNRCAEIHSDIAECHKRVLKNDAELRRYKTNGINSIRVGIEGIKGGHAYTVLNMTGVGDKPLYSNEAKRTSALNKLLENDPMYAQAKKALKDAETKQFELEQLVQYAKIDLEEKRNALTIWKSQMELASSLSREEQTHKLSI